jgi:hypothetical protein
MVTFRKSKKIGPLRVTATKRGLSVSGGIKGARVSVNSKGQVHRTLSAPGTGVYDRKRVDGGSTKAGRGGAPQAASVELSVNDYLGPDRKLFNKDPDIEPIAVVGLREFGGTHADIAQFAGITAGDNGYVRGIREALLMAVGDDIRVLVRVLESDNPALFTKKERKKGATPRAVPVGRLGKREAAAVQTQLRITAEQPALVGLYIDATPGLELCEVRYRKSLLEDVPG